MKQIKVQIFSDGRVQADVAGVKGKTCTNFIGILEEILGSEAVDSHYTPEFYEIEQVEITEVEKQRLGGN